MTPTKGTAEEILRRLADAAAKNHAEEGRGTPDLCGMCLLVNEANAYLSRPQPVYAEGWAVFVNHGGPWHVYVTAEREDHEEPDGDILKIRLPVPAHLLSPEVIEGEVVEKP